MEEIFFILKSWQLEGIKKEIDENAKEENRVTFLYKLEEKFVVKSRNIVDKIFDSKGN